MSKVFISHKKSDASLALLVAARVRQNSLQTYLDTIDDALLKDGPNLADHLLEKMHGCDQLIAVVSPSTKDSWWVPWEIGVGSEKNFRMVSYSESYVSLPSYLKKWPELHSESDIDLYCNLSKSSDQEIALNSRKVLNENSRAQVSKDGARAFHNDLKRRLFRGY